MATIEQVKQLIANQLGSSLNDISEDSRIVEDLGAESSDVANIVAAVEDRFSIKVPEEKVQSFATVRDIYQGIVDLSA
jgi:acyl carrier protein